MAYTILLFVTRRPDLSPEAFRDHYENVHIPLAQRLCAGSWPYKFTRQYLARITRRGFGGPANPDRPPLLLRGDADVIDYDVVSEMTFESEGAFQAFYKRIYEKDVAAKLAADENEFLQLGKTRVVVVGETVSTEHGITRSYKNCPSPNDTDYSDGSMSEQS
ncbi:EthD domain-containing protein [Boeremia exigua]|uniref:EthD domain-containing protein n=1 Tax=Boeremia exigua TaxID=749465 RepID=UPI001E8CBBB6|nr:EthD domain-containing protein [Boeremia exigua]KAH6616801.1 EthD domain-containing protein [Boeremia exigua]